MASDKDLTQAEAAYDAAVTSITGGAISVRCGRCGRYKYYVGSFQHLLCNCVEKETQPFTFVPQGWQCPLCKTVHAPNITKCECATS